MPSSNTTSRSLTRQSQVLVNSTSPSDMAAGQACALSRPIARDSGSQNTLRP